MKKLFNGICLIACIWLLANCSDKTKTSNESGSNGNTVTTDSSTTNPINSEYGTPNASENPVDSAQSVNQDSTQN